MATGKKIAVVCTGALVYANSTANFSHSAFQSNGLTTTDYSVFLNTAGRITLQNSTLEPAGQRALYDNAGNMAATAARAAVTKLFSQPSGTKT